MSKFLKVAAAAALVAAGASAHALAVIDDFSVAQAVVTDLTSGGVNTGSAWSQVAGAMLGGHRELYVRKSGDASSDGSRGVRADVGGGSLAYSQDSGAAGVGIVRWDGVGQSFDELTPIINGLGGVNLTSIGVGIRVQVNSADLNFPFTFQVWTDPTNTNTWTMSSATTAATAGAGVYDLYFGSFAGADFSRVGAVQLVLNNGTTANIDIEIDMIRGIPEPGTLALVGGTLLGLGALRRRKTAA